MCGLIKVNCNRLAFRKISNNVHVKTITFLNFIRFTPTLHGLFIRNALPVVGK